MFQFKVQTLKVGVYLLLSALLFQMAAPVVAQISEPDALSVQREYKNPLQVSVTAVDKLLSAEDQFEFTVSVTNDATYPMTNVWVQLPTYSAIEYLALDAEALRVERLAPNETLQIPVSAKLLEANGEMGLKVSVTAVEAKTNTTILTLNTKGEAGDLAIESTVEPAEPWQYSFNPPGSSGFTGSAQYSYGFDVPPGDGGLTPALSVSYGSRGIDSLRAPVMSNGFGSGWSMPQAEIINENPIGFQNGQDFYNHKFTLMLNGSSYPLIYKNYTGDAQARYGEYLAIGNPTLYIRYRGETEAGQGAIPNDSGEYWEVRTSNGTVYRFGYTAQAEQVVEIGSGAASNPDRNEPQPRNDRLAPTSWKLDLITDADDHKVEYIYQTKCFEEDRTQTPIVCRNVPTVSNPMVASEADVALQEIRYNFVGSTPKTKIEFTYQFRNNHSLDEHTVYKTVGYYQPVTIRTMQHVSGSTYQQISRYQIAYHETSQNVGPEPKQSWWIDSITRYGADDVTALPPTQFEYLEIDGLMCDDGYNNCVPYLEVVKNGYGAVSKLTYEEFNTDYQVVSDIHTWDGVNNIYLDPNVGTATSHTEYDYSSATACYNSAGDPCGDTTPNPSDPETYPHNFTDSLVGFSEVKTYAKDPVSPYSTLSSSEQTFVINDYWGKGRTVASTSYLPGTTTPIQETVNTWVLGTEAVRLGSTETFIYDNTTSLAKVGTKQTYHYNPAHQGGQQLGLTTQVDTQIWDNTLTTPGWSAVQTRSTTFYIVEPPDDGDDFYQIVPWTQGLYEGDWTPLQVSLLLYDGNTNNPDTQTVTEGKLTLQRVLLPDTEQINPGIATMYDTIDTAFVYDGFGNQQKIRAYDTYGRMGYNPSNNWVYSIVPTTYRETEIGYSADGRTIEWTENPADHRSQYSYDPLFTWLPATMGTEIDTGTYASSTYKYDTFGRLIEIYDDQESTTEPLTVYTYNDTNGAVGGSTPFSMKTETRPDVFHNNAGGTGYELASISYLDGLGRTLQTVQLDGFRDSNNDDQHVRTAVAYDALGRTICTTSPQKVTTTAYDSAFDCLTQSEITTQTYDDAGRVASITDVDGSVTRQYYGNTGGNETYVTTIDANHHRTQAHTDMFGNLVASIEYSVK